MRYRFGQEPIKFDGLLVWVAHAGVFRGARISSLPIIPFVGREEIRAPLKTPAWVARFGGLIFGGAYFRNFTVLHKNMSLKKSLKKRFDMNIQEKVTKRRK